MGENFDRDEIVMYYEIRGLYDGWSAAMLSDGRIVNRWSPEDGRRYTETEKFIAELKEEA